MKLETLDAVYEMLKNPDKCYRSIPFWGWNASMEKEELEKQIEGFKTERMGGFFIHSREGLETEYLSEEWMQLVNASVNKAEKEEMEAWLYDEDKWPSGSAGGLISKTNPEHFTAKGLTLEVVSKDDPCEKDERILGSFLFDHKKLIFRKENSLSSEWYNGLAPTDNLNKEAVKEFLTITHEAYEKKMGDKFGKTMKGFFTDEPNFCDFFSVFENNRPWLPWGENFETEFFKRRGYDILEKLPGLFYETKDCEKVRHDYWWTMTELFSENYMKQIYDWCEARKVKMTGHVLYENDMGYGVRVSGGAMPHYRYMHAPGIDILGVQAKEYLTVKQCTSVANQYGRDMVVSETYGCSGWEMTMEEQKWLGDWQYVLGVTRRCQHLALYSITGCRKRDYPPVFNYQNSWWDQQHILEDYFARLSVCTTAGDAVRDILVIHPLTTMWMKSRGAENENLNNLEMNMGWLDEHLFGLNREGEIYNRFAAGLLSKHYDFDFGDEIILSEKGVVSENKLVVGKGTYSMVIVPPVETLLDSTVHILEKYLKNGGKVIWIGHIARRIEGELSEEIQKLSEYPSFIQVKDYDEAYMQLNHIHEAQISIRNQMGIENSNILAMLRRVGDDKIAFLVNHNRTEAQDIKVTVKGCKNAVLYDPMTGKFETVKQSQSNRETNLLLHLAPSESKIVFLKEKDLPEENKLEFPYLHPHRADVVWATLGPEAEVSLTMENTLILDTCIFQSPAYSCSKEMPVWQVQKNFRSELKMQQNYYNGAPQRYTWIHKECPLQGQEFKMIFQVEVVNIPKGNVYLAVERSKEYTVFCNSQKCILSEETFLDHEIQKWLLPELKKGINEIVISGRYMNATELEDVYLVGNFGVDANRRVTDPVKKLHFGDWCYQGLYHYGGAVMYHFTVDKELPLPKHIVIKPGEYKGTLLKVIVNGKEAGDFIGQTPEELDITKYLTDGKNNIDLLLYGSLRNVMGPFHQTYTGCSRISWEDFRTQGNLYTEKYVLESYGLMGQIVLAEKE